jgi:hypothetical protein
MLTMARYCPLSRTDEPGDGEPHEHGEVEEDDLTPGADRLTAAEPRCAVGPGTEEEGVTERHLSGVTGEQVQTDGADGVDADGGEQAQPEVVELQRQHDEQGDEQQQPGAQPRRPEQAQVLAVVGDEVGATSCHQTLLISGVPNRP